MEICGRYDGAIIGADSRQIYKKLDIGTAKPTREDMKKIPHYMVDIVEITEDFTAVDFSVRATEHIEGLFRSGKLPLVVGGAGLYLEALAGGIVDAPPKNEKIREKLEKKIAERGSAELYAELKRFDPKSAELISPNDPVRIVRALEIFELSGEPASLIREKGRYLSPDIDFLWIGLDPGREWLYERINARVDWMISAGLVEETRKIVDDGLGEALKRKKIVGYAEILELLGERSTEERAVGLIKQHTRNYAKRQMTWFRNRLRPKWMNPLENGFQGKVFELIDEYLKRT